MDGASSPRVSVVIPAYNAAMTVTDCLEALASQDFPKDEFEILVVDDGSTDQTASLVEIFASRENIPGTRLLRQKNSGPAAARNFGAGKANGELILFTDSDCFPLPDWMNKMTAPFVDSEVVGVKGSYLTKQTSWTARFVQIEYESKYHRMAKFRRIDFIDTYSAAFRKSVFLEAGGFDTTFAKASVEDQEFSFRLAASGHKMVFIPDARVAHLHVDTPGGYARKKFKIGYYKALLLLKHPGRISGDTHTPRTLEIQIVLVYSLLLFGAGWWARLLPGWFPAIAGSLYASSLLPFTAFALARSRLIALIGPAMITCRAIALGAGLFFGLIRFLPSRFHKTREG